MARGIFRRIINIVLVDVDAHAWSVRETERFKGRLDRADVPHFDSLAQFTESLWYEVRSESRQQRVHVTLHPFRCDGFLLENLVVYRSELTPSPRYAKGGHRPLAGVYRSCQGAATGIRVDVVITQVIRLRLLGIVDRERVTGKENPTHAYKGRPIQGFNPNVNW